MRAATQPPTTKAKNAPATLNTRPIKRTFFQSTYRDASCAPTAVPIRPMMSPTASAASVPTQIPLQLTGQAV